MILVLKNVIIRVNTFTFENTFSRFPSLQKSVVYRIPLVDYQRYLIYKDVK